MFITKAKVRYCECCRDANIPRIPDPNFKPVEGTETPMVPDSDFEGVDGFMVKDTADTYIQAMFCGKCMQKLYKGYELMLKNGLKTVEL